MSVERGGTQLAITSAERCSPRAQLHLQRLLEGSPPRRLRFHAGSGVFSSSPIHETGSVTTRTGPSPLANVSFYEWCCDEQQCLIKAEERARQALADETFSGTWKDFAAQTHQLLKWFLKEYAGAKDVLATVLPPLATIGNSKEVESQSTSSGEKSSAESTAALQHGNSTFSDLVKRAVLTANEEHIRCTTAMQAVIDIQRRMDAFCAEAMEDRDALVAALRDGEDRYAALMEGSQDAVHASRCAADEADFWEEAATARDTVLENISRELGALLAEHHHHGESTKKRRAQRIETKSRNANNGHENAITEPELSNVPSGEENIEKEDEYEEETPLLASLREVPACATAVMDGPRKWSLLLSHKLNTITTMYKEAQARSSIYEGFGTGARELAQDFFAAETAVSEALTDTVALLDAKQRHREMLEGKLRDAQLALEQVKEQSRKESSLRDDEVTALWDLLVRGQEEHDAREAVFDAQMAKKPIMRSCTIQTTSSMAPSTPNATSSPSVNVLPHDGPVAITLPRSVDMSLQEATRLPTARIAASTLLLRDGIFGATFVLHDNSAAVSPSSRSHLVVDIRGKCLQLRKSPSSSVSNETATSSGSPLARRSSMIGASSVTVYSNDILGVARVPSDIQRLTVMLSSGAPLQLRFPSTQSREWAYEYLKLLQSTNTVDVVSHVYLGLTPAQKAEDKVLGDANGTATSTRRVQFFAEEETYAAPVKQLIVDASSMTLAAPPATNTTSTSTTTTVTVFHDASHWHDIRLSIIVSTVTVDDPVPAELQADSNVSQEVDIIVAALQVAKSAHQYQEAVDGERSVSPGAEVESTIARTTIVSKALQDVLSRNQSTSPLTVESSSSIYAPLSPKGSKTSLWTAAAAAHKFVVALVNEEESDMIYFVLVRKELIYAIQHLRLMTASHDVVNTVGAKCSTVSLQVNETSIGFMFTRALNNDNNPQAAVSLAEIVPQVLSQSSQSVPEAITQGSTGSTAGGGGALELLDPCCQWHFMFVIKPRIHEPVLILPEGQISHQFIGRDATITLLHAANIEHRSAFLSTYGQIATTSATVPLHRFTLRTTRSHATILHPLSSTGALVPSSSTISYPTRRLSITSVTLKLTQDLSELSSPWSPNNIFTSTTTIDSTTSSSAVNIELESVIGAAPLSLALAEDNDEQHLDGEKRFTSQGPVEFEYLVSCNTCCAEALLKIREQPVSTSNKRRTQIAGSASTSLLPLLNASVHAPSRIVAPWFVQGREVGYITIEGNLL